MIGIYRITCLVNKKIYIGSSRDLKQREARHWRDLRLGKHHSVSLQNSFNLYGENNFKFDILQELKFEETLYICEQIWFHLLNPEFNSCKIPGKFKTRVPNPNKKYTLISPDGEIITFQNIKKFCRDYSLDFSAIYKVIKGKINHHKKWTLTLESHELAKRNISIRNLHKRKSSYVQNILDCKIHRIYLIPDFCKEQNCTVSGVSKLLNGKIKQHRNFKLWTPIINQTKSGT